MDDILRKQFIKKTFDTVAPGYDKPALRFFQQSVEKLPLYFAFKGHEQVLDAATGTGVAALNLASALAEGKVIGVDMSEGMLAQAQSKAVREGFHNVDFVAMDIEDLQFSENAFDHINCSFGLFFVEDMKALLGQLVTKLKPGGKFISCCFSDEAFQPHADLFYDRIVGYGVEIPAVLGFKRLADEEKSTALYESVGLKSIKTYRHHVSFLQKDANEWWDVLWYAGFRGFLDQLDASALKAFKREHLKEISELPTDVGIDFKVEVIFTVGEK